MEVYMAIKKSQELRDREKTSKNQNNNEYDSPWKTLLENLLPDFLELFFPSVHAVVDWSYAPKSRDKELPRSMQKALSGTQVVDKVVEVRTRENTSAILFIHVEVQAQRDENFAKRMFQYNVKLCERFGDNVESLAILTDDSPSWKPANYTRNGIRTSLRFSYGVAKLREVETKINSRSCNGAGSLNTNPFAWVVRAHVASLQTRRDERKRFVVREELLRGLFATNICEAKVRDVATFYEWVLQLSPELEKEFRSVEERVEGAMGKPFITAREREAIEKGVHQGVQQGMQQGMQQGTAEMVKEALEERLNGSSGRFADKIMLYSPADLKLLLRLLVKTSSAEEIENWFKTHPPSKNSANN